MNVNNSLPSSSLISLYSDCITHIVGYLKIDEVGRLCLINKKFYDSKQAIEKALAAEVKRLEMFRVVRTSFGRFDFCPLKDAERVYDDVDCQLVHWISRCDAPTIRNAQVIVKGIPNRDRLRRALITAGEINEAFKQPTEQLRLNLLEELVRTLGAENRLAVAFYIAEKDEQLRDGGGARLELIKVLANIGYDLIQKKHPIRVQQLIQRIRDRLGRDAEKALQDLAIQLIANQHYQEAISFAEAITDANRSVIEKIAATFCKQGLYDEAFQLLHRTKSDTSRIDTLIAEKIEQLESKLAVTVKISDNSDRDRVLKRVVKELIWKQCYQEAIACADRMVNQELKYEAFQWGIGDLIDEKGVQAARKFANMIQQLEVKTSLLMYIELLR